MRNNAPATDIAARSGAQKHADHSSHKKGADAKLILLGCTLACPPVLRTCLRTIATGKRSQEQRQRLSPQCLLADAVNIRVLSTIARFRLVLFAHSFERQEFCF
jgi:hypothetical protein